MFTVLNLRDFNEIADNVPRLHGVAAFGNSFFHNRKTNL